MLTNTQIQSICDEVKQEPGVIAILLAGSYVYGRRPTDESDLDLRVIVSETKYEKAHWDDMYRFGVSIEAFYNTIATIENLMEQARKKEIPRNVVHFWANGKIVFDSDEVVQKLQAKARTIWKLGPYKGIWEKRN
jgi:predicted nucleotidyltransferase